MTYYEPSRIEKFMIFFVLMLYSLFLCALGYLNLSNCPVQPFLPIYMFTLGLTHGLTYIYWYGCYILEIKRRTS